MKKLLAILAAVALLLPTFGCSIGKEENVTLKWVMIGPGEQEDAQMVWDKFNEMLQDYLPGVQVDFEVVSSGYNQRWQLMMSSKEPVDIAWTGYAVSTLSQDMSQGSYLQLDKLIKKYGQDMTKELDDWVFDLGRIDGKTYLIPCYQTMSTSPVGLRLLKDQTDKYLDVEKLKETFNAWETDPAKGEEFYGMLGDYFQKLKDNGELKDGVGIIGGYMHTQKIDDTTVRGFKIDTDEMKVFYEFTSDDMKLWYKTAAEWYQKGYIPQNAMTDPDYGSDPTNRYVCWQHPEYNEDKAEQESIQHGMNIEVVPIGKDWVIKNSVPSTAITIPSTSKHPEKAMQLINLINSEKGKDLYNLLTYGIEGVHYEKIGENRIKPADYVTQGEEDSAYGLWKWAVGNTLNAYEVEVDRENLSEYVKSLDENAIVLPTVGFKPDTTGLSAEISQLAALVEEYSRILERGAEGANWEAAYNEFAEKVEKAGVQKVIDSLQAQLDEFIKAK